MSRTIPKDNRCLLMSFTMSRSELLKVIRGQRIMLNFYYQVPQLIVLLHPKTLMMKFMWFSLTQFIQMLSMIWEAFGWSRQKLDARLTPPLFPPPTTKIPPHLRSSQQYLTNKLQENFRKSMFGSYLLLHKCWQRTRFGWINMFTLQMYYNFHPGLGFSSSIIWWS